MHNFVAALGWIFLSLLPGILGSVFTLRSIPTWYAHLKKPTWTPPNWVFGPVWTLLYVLMGISASRVWEHGGFTLQRIPLGIFCGQLALNLSWTIIFFGQRKLDAALQAIVFLWFIIAITIGLFATVDYIAALLLVPYLLWVSYAALLNSSIYLLNRNRISGK